MYVSSYVNKHGVRRIQVTLSLEEASLIASGDATQLREHLLDLPEMTNRPFARPEGSSGDLGETLDAIAPLFARREPPRNEPAGEPTDEDEGT